VLDHITGIFLSMTIGAAGTRRLSRDELTPEPVSRWVARSGGPLVVITHTLGGPQGRTLGVDIFFVLSGFLITNVIVAELARRGTASLRRFYIRRMFRLFPALFVFLLAVLIWAQAFAPPILASRDTVPPQCAGAAIVIPSICGIRSSASSSSINSTSVMGLGCLWWCCCFTLVIADLSYRYVEVATTQLRTTSVQATRCQGSYRHASTADPGHGLAMTHMAARRACVCGRGVPALAGAPTRIGCYINLGRPERPARECQSPPHAALPVAGRPLPSHAPVWLSRRGQPRP